MLNVAYIGFGNSVIRYHLPYVALRKETVCVKYIYRREEDRLSETERERETLYPNIIFTTDLDDILNDADVNLVVVNSPHDSHVYYAKKALDAGKHVLVEKPIALTYAETEELLEYASTKNLICMPNHNRRYDTDFVAVKDAVASGKLGRIVEVESHYDYFRPGAREKAGMGMLLGLGIHTIDQIIALLGIPQNLTYDVRSLFFETGADDYYDIDFFYPGKKAIMKTSLLVKTKYPRFIVHGDNGSFIKYGGKHNSDQKIVEPVVLSLDIEHEDNWGLLEYLDDRGNTIVEKVPSRPTDYGIIYDSLYDSIHHGKEKLISDEEVLASMRIVEEAMKACK